MQFNFGQRLDWVHLRASHCRCEPTVSIDFGWAENNNLRKPPKAGDNKKVPL